MKSKQPLHQEGNRKKEQDNHLKRETAMKRGKQTCRILKEIRRQIAEANDIAFITAECQYKGDCPGTCPKCEAEVCYLEQELAHRRMTGKLVTLAGISAGMLTMNAYPNPGGSGNTVIPPSPIELRDTINPNNVEIPWIDPKTGAKDTIKEDGALFGIIETMPEFPDGMGALLKYIADHLVYPEELKEACIQGRVVIQCDIEKDGSIRNARVKKGIHPLFDAEALRVVNSMPRWKPGTLRGEPVKVKYQIPIEFHLQALSKNSSEQDSVPHRTKAIFPGGIKAMLDYLKIEGEYPLLQGDIGDMGRVVVDFEISKDGKVEHPRIRRGLGPILDRIALELVWKMPRWTPATENGTPVSDQYTVPVRFVPHYISYEEFKAKEEYSIKAERSTHAYGKKEEDLPDTFPKYPGGLKKLVKDMTAYGIDMWERFGHPEWGFIGNGARATTSVGFIVETDGSISNIEVRKRLEPVLDKEAVRFIEQMPRWTPGTKDGKIVRCHYLIPVSFRIQ